ncbi:MAG: hypothetical protein FJX02_12370 [Alphaproteobacteria bacterium]|nr:hypothetical protein [Alphaproteobacteria bacterium]
MPDLIPTLRTAVNTWQCDENDHLNVQFYTGFADEAVEHLLAALELGPSLRRAGGIVARPCEDHIRYHREFRVIDGVAAHSAPSSATATTLDTWHRITRIADGALAATVRRRLQIEPALPEHARACALAGALPPMPEALPRGLGKPGILRPRDLAGAVADGLIEANRTVIQPAECNADGELAPRFVIARCSDSAPILWDHLGFDRSAMQQRGEGSIVVEMRVEYLRPARAGTLLVVRSGLGAFTDKTVTLMHYLFDGETGEPVVRAEGLGMKFDQTRRKIMAFSADDLARLEDMVVGRR